MKHEIQIRAGSVRITLWATDSGLFVLGFLAGGLLALAVWGWVL